MFSVTGMWRTVRIVLLLLSYLVDLLSTPPSGPRNSCLCFLADLMRMFYQLRDVCCTVANVKTIWKVIIFFMKKVFSEHPIVDREKIKIRHYFEIKLHWIKKKILHGYLLIESFFFIQCNFISKYCLIFNFFPVHDRVFIKYFFHKKTLTPYKIIIF